MPIIKIYSQPLTDAKKASQMVADVQSKGAEALHNPIENVWVMHIPLPEGTFVGAPLVSDAIGSRRYAPIVEIFANAGRSNEQKGQLVTAVKAVVAEAQNVANENVWIRYQEMNPNDIWPMGT